MKFYGEKIKAIEIKAAYEDFDGGDEKDRAWQYAFYQMWRYQLTYDFAYEIKVNEYSDNTLDMIMIIRPSYKDAAVKTMRRYGYRNIRVRDCKVLEISHYDGDMENEYEVEAAVIQY